MWGLSERGRRSGLELQPFAEVRAIEAVPEKFDRDNSVRDPGRGPCRRCPCPPSPILARTSKFAMRPGRDAVATSLIVGAHSQTVAERLRCKLYHS